MRAIRTPWWLALGALALFACAGYALVEDATRAREPMIAILMLAATGFVLAALAWFVFRPLIARAEKAEQDLHEAESELARLRAGLEALTAELARSNAEFEQFAHVASHDLQEPLRMTTSYAQLLSRRYAPALDEHGREFVGFILDGSARMQQLVQDLLALSRVSTQGKPFEPVDCAGALERALDALRGSIEESGALVTHDTLPLVPRADEAQVAQVFRHLIANSIKFRGDAPPRVHVSARLDGERWEFQVQDNGIGIEAQYHERVFVLFQRLHARTEYPGTGIGLTISKKIVERHGGRIWVQSAPRQGARFYFTLPARADEPTPAPSERRVTP